LSNEFHIDESSFYKHKYTIPWHNFKLPKGRRLPTEQFVAWHCNFAESAQVPCLQDRAWEQSGRTRSLNLYWTFWVWILKWDSQLPASPDRLEKCFPRLTKCSDPTIPPVRTGKLGSISPVLRLEHFPQFTDSLSPVGPAFTNTKPALNPHWEMATCANAKPLNIDNLDEYCNVDIGFSPWFDSWY
jgi:hypothetical protein